MPALTVSYTTEELVRRAIGGILGGRHRGDVVCGSCLVGMTLELLHAGWRRSEIELAMDKVFEQPGALTHVPTGPCARCRRSRPCLRCAS
jgi:hypothetical protein